MTDDTISRQAAIEAIRNIKAIKGTSDDKILLIDKAEAQTELMMLPTAERKGHWQITDAYPHNVYCSECHERFAQTHWAVWEDGSLPRTYCPNCGARMEGEQ